MLSAATTSAAESGSPSETDPSRGEAGVGEEMVEEAWEGQSTDAPRDGELVPRYGETDAVTARDDVPQWPVSEELSQQRHLTHLLIY